MSKRKASSFPVEFLSIWQLAAAERLHLCFPTKGAAVSQKQQLQIFRKRLLEEAPEVAIPFFQVDLLIIEEPEGPGATLVSYIPEWKKQVRAAVQAADFSPMNPAEILRAGEATAQAENMAELDKTLDNLGFKS